MDGIYDSLPRDQLTEHVIINTINNHEVQNNILDLRSTFDKIKKILFMNYKKINS